MPTDKYGYDHETHHLLSIKRIPASLEALRSELAKPEHRDISDEAIQAKTFEEALGIIAARLDIAVDGFVDVDDFSDTLCSALRRRHLFKNSPHLRDARLVNAEMHEKEGTIELVQIPDNVPAIITSDGFPVESEPTPAPDPVTAPGHTDLMITPEAINEYLKKEFDDDN